MRRPGNRLLRSVPLTLAGFAAVLGLAGCVGEPSASTEAGVAPGYGYRCYAGVYMCRLPQQVPLGAECSCPGLGAPSYGTVR